jgi:multiple sugar transport system substrate-binding protein
VSSLFRMRVVAIILLSSILVGTCVGHAKDVTKLAFWNKRSGLQMEADMLMAKEFERTHPGIEVEHVSVTTDYYNKLSVAIAAGVAPDVAQLIATFSLAEFAEGGLIQPLDRYIQKAGIQPRDFFPLVWDSWHYDGSIWAMTYDVDANMLYTNRALFAATGVTLPQTIQELDEVAKRLTAMDAEGNIRRMGLVPWLGDAWTWLAAWDGQLWDPSTRQVTANSPNTVAMFAWMASYSERYDYARINALTSQVQNYFRGDPLFNDLLGMHLNGPWAIGRFELYAPGFEWDMIPLPYAPCGKANSTTGNALTLVIPVGAKHPEEAFEYIRWRTSLEHVLERQKVEPDVTFPARVAAARAFVQKHPEYMPIANALAGPNSRPFLPTMPVSVFYSSELSRARSQVIQLQVSPEAALDAVTRVVQARLDEVLRTSRRGR